MIHVNPDLSRGILREKDGHRFFLRLWPDPVFLRESPLNSWSDIEDVQDDFNLTALVKARDKTVKELALSHPSLAASIVQRQQFIEGYELPIALQSLLRIQRRIEQREEFLSAIPPGTLGLVRRFPEAHFSLIKFFSEYPDGIELAETNPPLAFLLAIHGERFGASSSKSVHDLLRRKRAAILENLGFPITSERVVRLMGKVKPWACRAGLLTGFRQVLSDMPVVERLRHLPEINFGCMAVAAEKKLLERVSNGILHEIVDDRKEDKHPDTALKLQSCLELEEQRLLAKLPAVFHTRSGIQRLLVAEAEHLTPEEIEALGLTFYPSPLPDTPGIQALRTPEDVYEEGCEQGNCVWSLLPLSLGQRSNLGNDWVQDLPGVQYCREQRHRFGRHLVSRGYQRQMFSTYVHGRTQVQISKRRIQCQPITYKITLPTRWRIVTFFSCRHSFFQFLYEPSLAFVVLIHGFHEFAIGRLIRATFEEEQFCQNLFVDGHTLQFGD